MPKERHFLVLVELFLPRKGKRRKGKERGGNAAKLRNVTKMIVATKDSGNEQCRNGFVDNYLVEKFFIKIVLLVRTLL